jgi:NADPH:quinone reductase-like Zn-dependent oxidoreductase
MQGITVGSREDFTNMARAIAQHRLHPVIDRTFIFDEISLAIDHLSSGQHFGKITIKH